MVRFYTDGFENALVRITVYLTRREYEEAEQTAVILGYGNVERMVYELVLNAIRNLKENGYQIKPFWERD